MQEQVGYPIQTMLELGAGNGGFARAMSNLNVKMTTVELVPELAMFAKNMLLMILRFIAPIFIKLTLKKV